MKHKIYIHCFEKWWQATVEDNCYEIMTHNVNVLVSPAVRFNSKVIFDKTTNLMLENKNNVSIEQVAMETWLQTNVPTINLERRAFERQRKSYERRKGLDDIYKH